MFCVYYIVSTYVSVVCVLGARNGDAVHPQEEDTQEDREVGSERAMARATLQGSL